jgi:5-methylcytosine-specific restriction enzyme subunit McrC
MLSYAFHVLNEKGYNKIATEDFENTADLFSEILINAVGKQIKQGLYKDYIPFDETVTSIKGKMNITESINNKSLINKKMNCTYDEFSHNNYLNQIIKTTMQILLKSEIKKHRKKRLKRILMYFRNVDVIDSKSINWKIRYDRNNQNYRMIIGVCYLTLKGLLQSEKDGNEKLMEFLNDQAMSRLYEKFILEYYKKEYKKYTGFKAGSPQIKWQLDEDDDFDLLPKMQTDVTLEYKDKILIIDAKYYAKTTQERYNKKTIHSNNLYQIFTYVKNKEEELKNKDVRVSGMLLYARTNEELIPNEVYKMSGNTIAVRTLDLNQDFEILKSQLDEIANEYLFKIKTFSIF